MAIEFISTAARGAREAGNEGLAAEYESMGDLYERKLWHELSLKTMGFVRSVHSENHLPLLDNFVVKFEGRMNQLRYAELLCGIVVNAARAGYLKEEEAVSILDVASSEKKTRIGTEATIVIETEAALLRMSFENADLPAIKKKLEETKVAVEALTGTTDTTVFESFYRASANYYKLAGPPEAFYRTALKLLSYGDSRSQAETETLAVDVALAALTGEGIYNFGEVLATPILKNLDNSTQFAWLGQLLRIFHQSDVSAFAALWESQSAQINAQPALIVRQTFLKEKIAILALMNMLFETPSHSRTLSFQTIASRVQLPLDSVEWLVMRAMALNLVRGKINQVQATIHFEWVQPRVLDHSQINHLILQLDSLSDKSKSAFSLLADHTVDLL